MTSLPFEYPSTSGILGVARPGDARDRLGGVGHQAAREFGAARVDAADRIADAELAAHRADAGRQQALAALDERADRAVVEHDLRRACAS